MMVNIEQPMEVNTVITGENAVECNQGDAGMISFEVEHADWFTYDLRNSAGEVVRSGEVEGNQAWVDGLQADMYELSIYTTCSNEVIPVDLRDSDANTITNVTPEVSMLSDETALVTLSVETAQPAVCSWSLSNGTQVNGNTIQFETTTNSVIAYEVSCSGVCPVSTSGVVNVAALLLSNNEPDNQLPFVFAQRANEIQLTCSGNEAVMVNARVFDAQGRLMHSRSFVTSSGHLETFETAKWSKGVYTLSIEQNGTPLFSRAFAK
jgi:hypothetical protein